jgi:mRNA-degrading endonuclease toxin of MazEF toxin-antitoxin module
MYKDFKMWSLLKAKLNERTISDVLPLHTSLVAKPRELWWCHIGLNIGSEQDGKSEEYERPVVIISKLSSTTYLIAPTTSKYKNDLYRIKVSTHNDKFSYALIDQIKVIDARRLKRKIGVILEKDFNDCKRQIIALLH